MSQPTTIRLQTGPTISLRAPELGADVRRLVALAVHVATAAIVAASLATAVATAADRPTGGPSRLSEPTLVVHSVSAPAASQLVVPQPEPAPSPR